MIWSNVVGRNRRQTRTRVPNTPPTIAPTGVRLEISVPIPSVLPVEVEVGMPVLDVALAVETGFLCKWEKIILSVR